MKIIGSDYDGTLNHGGIDDKKLSAIEKWRKAGNIFALVSGRGPDGVLELYEEKQFGCDYLIANNGAVILTPDGAEVYVAKCDAALAKPLVKHLFENGCEWAHVQTSFYCRVFADEKNCIKDGEYTLENMPDVPYFSQINTQLPTFEKSAKVTASVNKTFGDSLNPLQNGECLDIVRKDIDKAKGLYRLAEMLSVDYNDIIAVGDNINDTHMIAEFRSYAMENAVDSIKELADFVTPGVAELIEKELANYTR
ncbi:MAG: HAD-IIB family hydrolase [Clostridia bacterium]|nr:HAD-IIB family hydrolase [Clostridia bacterium]